MEDILEELNLDAVDVEILKLLPDSNVSFKDMVLELVQGKIDLSETTLVEMIKYLFIKQLSEYKSGIIHVLLLVLIAAIFTNFATLVQSKQVSDICFFVMYILLLTVGLQMFQGLSDNAKVHMEELISFVKVLGPLYFLATSMANGCVTATGFYSILIGLIFLVQLVLLLILMPLIRIGIIIKMLNYLSPEDYLSMLGEFLETIVDWALKGILTIVVGINLVQGILGPGIDSMKRSVIQKGAEALPIVGDALGGATQLVFGSATVIKNGIGVAGAIICVMIVVGPIIETGIVALLYQFVAAIIQPISDKRIVGCIRCISDGAKFLMRIVFTTGVLFLITIAIVAISGG